MRRSDHLQGALELFILKSLEHKTNHGFGITLHVQTVSGGLLRMEEGSLYPALHRMEKAKLINTIGLSSYAMLTGFRPLLRSAPLEPLA